jgi:hypothetical protein
VDPKAVVDYAREHLADFKVPQFIVVSVTPLPRNPNGKGAQGTAAGQRLRRAGSARSRHCAKPDFGHDMALIVSQRKVLTEQSRTDRVLPQSYFTHAATAAAQPVASQMATKRPSPCHNTSPDPN